MPETHASLPEQKQRLRSHMRALRQTQAAQNPLAAKQLVDVFTAQIQLEDGAVVAAYRAMRDEMGPALLVAALRAKGHPIALPFIPGKQQALTFRLYEEGHALIVNKMGIEEPDPALPPVDPDILLVPLLAFDRHKQRLGYGGGYYDRTITDLRRRKKIRAIGIAYSFQEVAQIPVGTNDIGLDMIVTEAGIFD